MRAVQRETPFLSLNRVPVDEDAIEDDPIGNESIDVCSSGVAPLDQRPPAFLRDAVDIEKLQS